MKTMRWMPGIVIAAGVVKLVIWGTWWAGPVVAEVAPPRSSGAPEAGAPAGLPPALFEQSRGFREILDAVAARQEALAAKEQALLEREAGLAQLEKAVAEQVARLEALAGMSPGRAGAGAPPQAAPSRSAAGAPEPAAESERPGAEIVRIYETMKPEEAAPILDRLDDETLRTILGRMKERQIGAILAAMNRDRAVAFTKLLAASAQREAATRQVSPQR